MIVLYGSLEFTASQVRSMWHGAPISVKLFLPNWLSSWAPKIANDERNRISMIPSHNAAKMNGNIELVLRSCWIHYLDDKNMWIWFKNLVSVWNSFDVGLHSWLQCIQCINENESKPNWNWMKYKAPKSGSVSKFINQLRSMKITFI